MVVIPRRAAKGAGLAKDAIENLLILEYKYAVDLKFREAAQAH